MFNFFFNTFFIRFESISLTQNCQLII
uniref:Uncharacterized protein n=1 Tax=Rhizophora mucronata TaxID=61149 RepID=A0A2P2PYY5_RHIMU